MKRKAIVKSEGEAWQQRAASSTAAALALCTSGLDHALLTQTNVTVASSQETSDYDNI